jgi:RNA recognition motif-containing protein
MSRLKNLRDEELSRRREEMNHRRDNRIGGIEGGGEEKVVEEVGFDGTRIYVGNMPYIAQKGDVEKLFADVGIEL